MKRWVVWLGIVLGSLSLSLCALAQWQSVAPGIDYQEFSASGPNNVFVTRMDRDAPDCTIDSCIAQGKLVSGREPVSAMANRYEDVIGYWGQTWGTRYDVVAAINGDGFSYETDLPTGGQIISGWYAKRFNEFSGAGFVWTLNRQVFLAECVNHRSDKNIVAYPATGQDQHINGINTARGADELIIYTPQYDSYTPAASGGAEVLVELSRPMLIMPLSNYVSGTVREIRPNQGTTPLPFDCVVLSADGAAAAKLLANVGLGSEVRISQEITHYQADCSTPGAGDLTKTYSCIGYMSQVFLRDGIVYDDDPPSPREPRTAVAYNNDYIFFVVCDGRSGISVGMTYPELGNFCLNTLAATHGINQDGGGSSTLWVDGEVKNNPSDGSERYVANGLMMIRVQDRSQSSAFAAEDEVEAPAGATLRLGPGTNYGVRATVASGAEGTIVADALNGVLAKGQYWWKCDFGTETGWVAQSSLSQVATAAPRWEAYR